MKIDSKKLRVLFIDDEELEITRALKNEGYDIEYCKDVENLDSLCDGRYHVIFFDVKGIGGKYGGDGLGVLKYVAVHNPLIYTCVFSAKPFTGDEADVIRKYAGRALPKDCSIYDVIEMLEAYAVTLSEEKVTTMLDERLGLSWLDRWKLRRGSQLSNSRLEKLSKASKAGADAIKVVTNMTAVAVSLYKIINGVN